MLGLCVGQAHFDCRQLLTESQALDLFLGIFSGGAYALGRLRAAILKRLPQPGQLVFEPQGYLPVGLFMVLTNSLAEQA